jgi:hypothetical protein
MQWFTIARIWRIICHQVSATRLTSVYVRIERKLFFFFAKDSAWVISRTKKWDDKIKKEVDGIIDKYFIKEKMAEATHDADR